MFDDSTRYVPSRLTLWCPVCGAGAGKMCNPVGGLRFRAHDEYALGVVPRPVIVPEFVEPPLFRQEPYPRHKYKPTVMPEAYPARKPAAKGWSPNGWVN